MNDNPDRTVNPFYYSIGSRVRDSIFSRMFGNVRGKRLLDIGCGLGYFTDFFEGRGATSTGIDLDEKCLSYCRESMRGTYLTWDITAFPYPFPDGSFDLILCSEVLEHIQDNGKILDEVRRLLSDNGTFIASTPCSEGIFGAFFKNIGHSSVNNDSMEYHWHKGYSAAELSALLENHSLHVTETSHTMVALVEMFMGLTKVFVGKSQAKSIDSQSDALNMTQKPVWRLYKALFPFLLSIGTIEQPLTRILRGHMVIVKGKKEPGQAVRAGRSYKPLAIYVALATVTALAYPVMVELLDVQTVWVDVARGYFTVSIIALLLVWTWLMDKLSAHRKWGRRKSWFMSLSGIAILLLLFTPRG